MSISCKIEDGKLCVELVDVIRDEAVLREVAKTAIFDEYLIEGVGKLMIHGFIEYHDDTCRPWYSYWTGCGATFEKARRIFAGMADRIAQKLIADLIEERDKLFVERDEWRTKCFAFERLVIEGERQGRQSRELSGEAL